MDKLEKSCNEKVPCRERLLDSAEVIVARDGVGRLTLDAVAKEAGVSKGGVLYHFRFKSDLIKSIMERLASRCDVAHAGAMKLDTHEAGAFTRAYLVARARYLESRKVAPYTSLLMAASNDPQQIEPFRDRIAEWQTRMQNDGIDPVTAMIVRLAIDGLCLNQLFGLPIPEGDLFRQTVDRLASMTTA